MILSFILPGLLKRGLRVQAGGEWTERGQKGEASQTNDDEKLQLRASGSGTDKLSWPRENADWTSFLRQTGLLQADG